MISVDEARQIIAKNIRVLESEKRRVVDAFDYVLAEDVRAPISLPPFPQSAMDGYAILLHDKNHQLEILNESKAGSLASEMLQPGKTIRVFTGAPVPPNAEAVVMQENVEKKENLVYVKQDEVKKNENIRPIGEQISKGELALKKGTELSPATIGFLESLGIEKVTVFKKPICSILTTGDELVKAGIKLKNGQIYESNSNMLKYALLTDHQKIDQVLGVEDDFEMTTSKIEKLSFQNDLLMITGGISVGNYDYVGKSLLELGCKQYFYKVNQKPGKPLYFGKLNDCFIFALPGNPAAALTCYYQYVYQALNLLSGKGNKNRLSLLLPIAHAYNVRGNRSLFLKAIIEKGIVRILDAQASSMLVSFANANAMVYIPEETKSVNKGDLVEVMII